jgi:hypothetical protein
VTPEQTEFLANLIELGRVEEREAIASYIEQNAVLLSGRVRKPWLRLAAEIRGGEHYEDRPPQATPVEVKK